MIDEEALRPVRETLEQVRDRINHLLRRIDELAEFRCLRWRCNQCGYTKFFTRPMPAHVAPPCPKCQGTAFEALR